MGLSQAVLPLAVGMWLLPGCRSRSDAPAPSSSVASPVTPDGWVPLQPEIDLSIPISAPAEPPKVPQLAMGSPHTCVLLPTGKAWCWGDNTYGQLGDGTLKSHLDFDPVDVKLDQIAQLVAGNNFTCALRRDRTVWCWGTDTYSIFGPPQPCELSVGECMEIQPIRLPRRIEGIDRVRAIRSSDTIMCAMTDEDVYCWGTNRFGGGDSHVITLGKTPTKMGIGPVAAIGRPHEDVLPVLRHDGAVVVYRRAEPLNMLFTPDLHRDETLVAIAGGRCGLTRSGNVYCLDKRIEGLPRVLALPKGEGTVECVLGEDTRVWCWGERNEDGQLGDGTRAPHLDPRPLGELSGVVSLAYRIYRGGCAVTVQNEVWCWGECINGVGGDEAVSSLVPVRVWRF
jgi:hypothetical protein